MVIVKLTGSDVHDRSVFVTTGAFRARALRGLGYTTGTLILLWLAALIAGAVGAGRLPAVPFPAVGALREAPAAHAGQRAAPPSSQVTEENGRAPFRFGLGGPASRHGLIPSSPLSVRKRTSSVGAVRPQNPAAGNARPVPSFPSGGAAQPQPGTPPADGAAPGTTVPGPAPAGKGGVNPSVDRPPTAAGRSTTPPANRPLDPPAGERSAAPPSTQPVDPPAATPDTVRHPTTS